MNGRLGANGCGQRDSCSMARERSQCSRRPWHGLPPRPSSIGPGSGSPWHQAAAPRGFLLMEMFVYFVIVLAIVGVMSSSVFFASQALRKRAERELKDEHWLALVALLRDDLRSARKIYWKPPARQGQPDLLLAMKRPDGTKVELLRSDRRLLRRVTDEEGKAVETPYEFQTTALTLSVPKDGGKGLWDLQALPSDVLFTTNRHPVFLYLTVTVHGPDRRLITEQFGVTTRCEIAQEVQP